MTIRTLSPKEDFSRGFTRVSVIDRVSLDAFFLLSKIIPNAAEHDFNESNEDDTDSNRKQ